MPLSKTMQDAVDTALAHGGELVRHKYGRWSWPGCDTGWAVDSTTIFALHRRGYVSVLERGTRKWREDEVPVRVRIAVPADV